MRVEGVGWRAGDQNYFISLRLKNTQFHGEPPDTPSRQQFQVTSIIFFKLNTSDV